MNGAESLVRTLVACGVDVCFANPGTSEMHLLAALDQGGGPRCVLGLFEGVVTGAADGYARMAGKPAATLLHLGPGLANGLANIHNARRARSPMVNIVGEHGTAHQGLQSPLETDIEAVAAPFSDWVHSIATAADVGPDTARAIAAARSAPGRIATLIVPADAAWSEGGVAVNEPPAITEPATVAEEQVAAVAEVLRGGEPTLLFMTGAALSEPGLAAAGRIAAATGAVPLAQMSNRRIERGAGRVPVDRLRYPVDQAQGQLARFRHVVLVGTREPTAFFAYPGKPSLLAPEGSAVRTLARPHDDLVDALERLADRVGAAGESPVVAGFEPPPAPIGRLTGDKIAAALAGVLPEGAIVADESVSVGRNFFAMTRNARPHSWLQVTGGAIGCGLPLATGAAIACPDRPVICLEADGSAMYTLQALWTQAREGLNVTTVILSNRSYAILLGEMRNVGVEQPGPVGRDMMTLDRPAFDWPALAKGLGVEAAATDDAEQFSRLLAQGIATPGPFLIEALL
jgi:acetolactate synthase I/II/III large subunit